MVQSGTHAMRQESGKDSTVENRVVFSKDVDRLLSIIAFKLQIFIVLASNCLS